MSKKKTLRNWLNCRVTVPIVHTLDKRMKRIVAIASLFGYLFDEQKRDKDLELRLSKTMNLANNSASLTLPLVYHDLIWRSIEEDSNITEAKTRLTDKAERSITSQEAQKYAKIFVGAMPTYLLYDSPDVVLNDVIHLFESLPFILGTKSNYNLV